ncbi:MAG TPA: Clp protease N-terminal domain-containing protein [Gaiellaceae bacterium]|nr:Clp protease N-terminal domain-containing protein [Gaiellaceae bacterium]
MFERFTERARRVVVLAQEEARSLGHGFVGAEHILLGLLRVDQGIAARVLAGFELRADEVRQRLGEPAGDGAPPPKGALPFTPQGKRALEATLRSAVKLGHNYIGTEHLLLGVLSAKDSGVTRVLVDCGVSPAELGRATLLELGTADGLESVLSGKDAPARTSGGPAGGLRVEVLAAAWPFLAAAFVVGLLVGWLVWG